MLCIARFTVLLFMFSQRQRESLRHWSSKKYPDPAQRNQVPGRYKVAQGPGSQHVSICTRHYAHSHSLRPHLQVINGWCHIVESRSTSMNAQVEGSAPRVLIMSRFADSSPGLVLAARRCHQLFSFVCRSQFYTRMCFVLSRGIRK